MASRADQPTATDDRENELRATVSSSNYDDFGFFSVIFMTWLSPLISLGKRHNLSLSDIPAPSKSCLIGQTLPLFLSSWQTKMSKMRTLQSQSIEDLQQRAPLPPPGQSKHYLPHTDSLDADMQQTLSEKPNIQDHPAILALQPPFDGEPTVLCDTPSPGVTVPILAFISPVIWCTVFELLYYALTLFQPQIIKMLSRYFERYDQAMAAGGLTNGGSSTALGLWYAFLLGLIAALGCTCQMLKNHLQINWASRTTSSYLAALFDKAIRIAPFALQQSTAKIGGNHTSSNNSQSPGSPGKDTTAPSSPNPGATAGNAGNAPAAGDAAAPAADKMRGLGGSGPSSGSVTNHISQDTITTYPAALFANMCWSGPVTVFLCVILMYIDLGAAAFIVFFLMMLLFPYQLLMMKIQQRYRKLTLHCTDQRLKYTTQLLSGIRVIKLYAWEEPLIQRLAALRQEELRFQRISLFWKYFTMSSLVLYPFLVTYLALVFYVKFNNGQFSPEKVFLILSYLNTIRIPIQVLSSALQACVELYVSAHRIGSFISREELPVMSCRMSQLLELPTETTRSTSSSSRQVVHPNPTDDEPLVNILNCDFYWSSFRHTPHQMPVLAGVSLQVRRGELIGVISQSGRGKTALLLGILGELFPQYHKRFTGLETVPNPENALQINADFERELGGPDTGNGVFSYNGEISLVPNDLLQLKGRVGYCAQHPWLMNDTVRNNICVELPFDPVKFCAVVEAAALGPDLEILPQGLNTVISEAGVSLSGGQQARVAFARVLYHADVIDVVILDDIFAAVDALVARTMFGKGVLGILRDKAIIMALNSHYGFLQYCSDVLYLDYSPDSFWLRLNRYLISSEDNFLAFQERLQHDNEMLTHIHHDNQDYINLDPENDASHRHNLQNRIKNVPVAAQKLKTQAQKQLHTIKTTLHNIPNSIAQKTKAKTNDGNDYAQFDDDNNNNDDSDDDNDNDNNVNTSLQEQNGANIDELHTNDNTTSGRPATIADLSLQTNSVLENATTSDHIYEAGFRQPATIAFRGSFEFVRQAAQISVPYSTEEIETKLTGSFTQTANMTAEEHKAAAEAAARSLEAKVESGVDRNSTSNGAPTQAQLSDKVYLHYFQGSRGVIGLIVVCLLIVITAVGSQALFTVTDLVMIEWGNDSSLETPHHTSSWWITVSGVFLTASFIMLIGEILTFLYVSIDSSVHSHDVAVRRVFRATIAYLDTTPLGQTINRFSRDIDTLDRTLPDNFVNFIQRGMMITGVFVMSLMTSWVFAFAMLPLLGCLLYLRKGFHFTSVQLKRLETASLTPIYTLFGSVLKGNATVRAFGLQRHFVKQYRSMVDTYSRVKIISSFIERRFGYYLNLLASLYVWILTIFCVCFRNYLNSDTSMLAIVYSLRLTGLLQMTIRFHTQTVTAMQSVQRLKMLDDIPQEPPAATTVEMRRRLMALQPDIIRQQVQLLREYHQRMGIDDPFDDELLLQTVLAHRPVEDNATNDTNDVELGTVINQDEDNNGELAPTEVLLLSDQLIPLRYQQHQPTSHATQTLINMPYRELHQKALFHWPWAGLISFKNLSLRYRPDLPLVINQLSVDILPGTRVGIIGRTGSGKSTLLQALFRILQPAAGVIEIDGVDIQSLGVGDLRSRMSIVPQSPTLFSGTVRSNLDPLNRFTDDEIWNSLKWVYMTEKVNQLENGLESVVLENGNNFSASERQLICIARALLCQNQQEQQQSSSSSSSSSTTPPMIHSGSILVADEMTSSIPNDDLVQQAIRTGFAHCTMLIIAHRLHTVVDLDRILVIQPLSEQDVTQGKTSLVEYGVPYDLLQDPSSEFYAMCQNTGYDSFHALYHKAQETYPSILQRESLKGYPKPMTLYPTTSSSSSSSSSRRSVSNRQQLSSDITAGSEDSSDMFETDVKVPRRLFNESLIMTPDSLTSPDPLKNEIIHPTFSQTIPIHDQDDDQIFAVGEDDSDDSN